VPGVPVDVHLAETGDGGCGGHGPRSKMSKPLPGAARLRNTGATERGKGLRLWLHHVRKRPPWTQTAAEKWQNTPSNCKKYIKLLKITRNQANQNRIKMHKLIKYPEISRVQQHHCHSIPQTPLGFWMGRFLSSQVATM
jgi:hypothetical protein